MQVRRRKVHMSLGMTLDYTTHGQVNITMLEYIYEILNASNKLDPMSGSTNSSAATVDLFKVNEYCKKVNTNLDVEFHHPVSKIFFSTKRASPYNCTSISYLTTRVREPEKDDWAKLVHLIKYIICKNKLSLILSANGSVILKWCINGPFLVHPNIRLHAGGGI